MIGVRDDLAGIGASARNSSEDVGLRKIVALEKQWFLSIACERISDAIAEIQPGRMYAFTVPPISSASGACVAQSKGHHFDERFGEKQIETRQSARPVPRLDNDTRFKQRYGGTAP